jgi:hypothetical protein
MNKFVTNLCVIGQVILALGMCIWKKLFLLVQSLVNMCQYRKLYANHIIHISFSCLVAWIVNIFILFLLMFFFFFFKEKEKNNLERH